MMSSSTSKPCLTSSNTNPLNTQLRKKLIIKLSYPPGSRKRDSDSCCTEENKRRKIEDPVKPIITCYWVDSNYRSKSTTLSHTKDNDSLVEDKKIIKNQVSNTDMPQPKDNNIVFDIKKIIKNKVSKTEIAYNGLKESSRLSSKSMLTVKDNTKDSTKTASVTRVVESGLKTPMECVKRRQCWLILKRMLVDRDGWDFKDPPKIAMVDKFKIKAIGLKEIERKLRLYATPDEFASDIRLVFSNAMLMYPPRNHIYQIAKKFSQNFEHKWKSLKDTWELEDRRRSKTHRSRRY